MLPQHLLPTPQRRGFSEPTCNRVLRQGPEDAPLPAEPGLQEGGALKGSGRGGGKGGSGVENAENADEIQMGGAPMRRLSPPLFLHGVFLSEIAAVGSASAALASAHPPKDRS